ncbi:cysteine dioxygenase [Planobacterium oryzisoli]|uniref:Cysteine dioxygenase family protein n=1 Tax=Planobacterium oryzisoli TaxID=2771435 RepID=A0A931EBF4_9FLAO|nr:cysteine dioxygenase family protein [Planobacterium oryzisoli]MBF5027069.1 cysteine dioxygenase family protein [Planobacterium oryzisoli]
MRTPRKPRPLLLTLESLSASPKHFSKTVESLFRYGYEDYNEVFHLDQHLEELKDYRRLEVLKGIGCSAILMLWGKDNQTAIHDHRTNHVKIKVLQGTLTQVCYRENPNFIEYNGVDTAHKDQSFSKQCEGIHSIINMEEGPSVSLHVYRTQDINLKGVRLFDTVKRRIAYLSASADSYSWSLPSEAYEKIIDL